MQVREHEIPANVPGELLGLLGLLLLLGRLPRGVPVEMQGLRPLLKVKRKFGPKGSDITQGTADGEVGSVHAF